MAAGDEQRDELEALAAIFGDDFSEPSPGLYDIAVRPTDGRLRAACSLRFGFGAASPGLAASYPRSPPALLSVVSPDASIPEAACAVLGSALAELAGSIARDEGGPAILRLVEALKEQLRVASSCIDAGMHPEEATRILEFSASGVAMGARNDAASALAISFFQLVPPWYEWTAMQGIPLDDSACDDDYEREQIDESGYFAWRDPRAEYARLAARLLQQQRREREAALRARQARVVCADPLSLRGPGGRYLEQLQRDQKQNRQKK
eukprot:m51a1_g7467 hypothetical protein (265) ;mRNA; r:166640-167819